MRNMSFMHTKEQILKKTKTVTRRLGWKNLKAGEILQAVEKNQGLKKGEKVKKLAQIIIVDVRSEPLKEITQEDVLREGFPESTPEQFINFFCKAMKCTPETQVRRIEFRYLDQRKIVDFISEEGE